jgi:hypothetical protein
MTRTAGVRRQSTWLVFKHLSTFLASLSDWHAERRTCPYGAVERNSHLSLMPMTVLPIGKLMSLTPVQALSWRPAPFDSGQPAVGLPDSEHWTTQTRPDRAGWGIAGVSGRSYHTQDTGLAGPC